MKIIKPLRLSFLFRPYRFQKKNYLSLVAVLYFDFKNYSLLTEQSLWNFFSSELQPKFAAELLDMGMPKSSPELLVYGYAYGKYAQNNISSVSISGLNIKKSLMIFGDREWDGDQITQPKPFEKIAISKFNSFGGRGFEYNPLGKGFYKNNEILNNFLPNVESINNIIHYRSDKPEPAGFTSIPIEYPERNKLMGTYDEKWRQEYFPGLANDIDWSYFNQAPSDQRLNSLTSGDKFKFINLNPDIKELEIEVPDLKVKAFLSRENIESDDFNFSRNFELKLNSIWMFPHDIKGYLIYQNSIEVIEDDDSEFTHALLCVESASEPMDIEYYLHVAKTRSGKDAVPLNVLNDKQLVSSIFLGKPEIIPVSSLIRNKIKRIKREEESLVKTMSDKGLSPRNPEENLKLIDDNFNSSGLDSFHTSNKVKENFLDKELDYISEKASNNSLTLDDILENEEPVKLNFWTILEQKRLEKKLNAEIDENLTKLAKKIGVDKETLKPQKLFEINDFNMLDNESELTSYKAVGDFDVSLDDRQMLSISKAKEFVSNKLKKSPTNISPTDIKNFSKIKCTFLEALENNTLRTSLVENETVVNFKLERDLLIHTTFNSVIFEKCNFSGTLFHYTKFSHCKFIDCTFDNCSLNEFTFDNCDLQNSSFNNLNTNNNINFVKNKFKTCEFKFWSTNRLILRENHFSHCKFELLIATRWLQKNNVFSDSSFIRVSFAKGQIRGVKFDNCFADSLGFLYMTFISNLHIDNCKFEKICISPNSVVNVMALYNSKIMHSGFRKTTINSFTSFDSDLIENDFGLIQARGAKFNKTSFKSSLFDRANLSNSVIEQCDFAHTNLKGAILEDVFLDKVSFFSAELCMVKTSQNLVQKDCLFTRANFIPRYGD
ncbi:DUF2169 domain-containing protein [Taylorella equigenitalis]|uniref:DUF2169 family type VI secretion system accessory protein n=1 Tax=Taylorella equigenitalis TaxID=29575 RepID=UPI000414FE11|nr:DUF2169 domain-containing protein [Taylorella equigenitalis]ASY29903.1 hypothetical protein B9Z30_00515 [Taylorella equigenitalis]KOS58949.1 hypothetical protein AM589_03310 [Taylorella equigenitalis]